uniref:Uncharacterized protein n=1 Tax=Lactuca sativa TaxID=4236 RepID=A0A9R1XDL9_LACSA|nr:hypothetical protein LSAT_V11C500259610 [Lactuca sativa]
MFRSQTKPSTTIVPLFFVLLFSSSITSTNHHHSTTALQIARPLSKLTHPVVILISSNGFRFGYQFKTSTPNIHRLIKNGTEAETGFIPVYPTLTFPNHYSIAVGLYSAYHGIINNQFIDPIAVPFEERVDTILHYFDLPNEEIPVFMTLYFEDPDHQGHQFGPDDPHVTEVVSNIHGLIVGV